MLPQSWLQVVMILVAVMPGFVYRSTLRGITGPRLLGGLVCVLGLAVPWATAWLRYGITTSDVWAAALSLLARLTRFRRPYDPTPTAWDHALRDRPEGWVRVLTGDGRWVGGWFGTASYASSWPEPRDLFIEVEYALTAEGAFTGEVVATQGCYVRCDDARLVDFIPDDARQEDLDDAQ